MTKLTSALVDAFNKKPVGVFVLAVLLIGGGALVAQAALTLNTTSVTSDAALTLTAGNVTVFYGSSTTGYVGIGTSTPATVLTITTTTPVISIIDAANNKQYRLRLGAAAASTFDIYDNSSTTSRLFIDGAGNVGISTTTPVGRFTVGSSTANTLFTVLDSGKVGIGSTTPAYTLTTTGSFYVSGTSTFSGVISAPSSTFTSFTTGSIPFFATGGALSQDNSNLYWDDSNNRLGIGTTTPRSILALSGANPVLRFSDTASGGKQFEIRNGSTTQAFDIYDFSSSTARLTINSGGNVGIGTSTPLTLFTVASGTTSNFFNVLGTGLVGVGTTTPPAELTVWGTSSSTVQIGSTNVNGCITLGDSDGSGVTYVTANDGVLSATTTKPASCR